MGEKNNLVLVVGAIVAFVLQIALAPAVALFSAQPNFLLAYALVVAIVIPTEAGPVLPFAMGLLYDLTARPGGRHGASAGHRVLLGFPRVLAGG